MVVSPPSELKGLPVGNPPVGLVGLIVGRSLKNVVDLTQEKRPQMSLAILARSNFESWKQKSGTFQVEARWLWRF